jgi:hypothetical protein
MSFELTVAPESGPLWLRMTGLWVATIPAVSGVVFERIEPLLHN